MRFLKWLDNVLFGAAKRETELRLQITDLATRLNFAEEQRDRFEKEVHDKTAELHMFVDALLIDAGRAPLYMTPTALKVESASKQDEEKERRAREFDTLRHTKNPRQWSSVASSLAESANKKLNGGV